MYFADSTPQPPPSYGALKTLLSRTQVPLWDGFAFAGSDDTLRLALSFTPEKMGAVARAVQVITLRLGESFAPGSAGGDDGLLAAVPWLRQAGLGLRPFAGLATEAGGSGEGLLDLVEQALLCQTLAAHLGRAKDAAMDIRVLLGGFAHHLLTTALSALRKEVAGLEAAGRVADAEALLAPFAPLLVLLSRAEADRAAGKDDARAREDRLAAEVQAATEERDEAAAKLRLRGDPPKDPAALAQIVRTAEPPPQPSAPAGRKRRR